MEQENELGAKNKVAKQRQELCLSNLEEDESKEMNELATKQKKHG